MTDEKMLKMRLYGATYQEIANTCGMSKQRVYQRLSKHSQPLTEYFSQDITFCISRECKYTKCERHHSHINWSIKTYRSFSDFEDTKYCPKKRGCNNG